MSLQKLSVTGLDNENQRRRLPETINQILTHQFDDSRRQTKGEKLSGVTPVNFAYQPGDVRRYGAKGDGVTDDTKAINDAILAMFGTGSPTSVIYLPEGDYKISGNIEVLSGVSIRGAGAKYTRLIDYASSGAALNCDVTLYNQFFTDFTIEGTNASGSRRAIYINRGNRSRFHQVNVSGYTSVTDGTYSIYIEGALYGLVFSQCYYSQNKRHLRVNRIGTVGSDPGNFPTACGWRDCLFEEATETTGIAALFTDTSGMWMDSPIFQANKSVTTLFIQHTSNGETSCDFKIYGRPWFEENGNSSASSIGIYVSGVSGNKCAGVTIEGLRLHGNPDNPRNAIYAEYTTGLRVLDAGGGMGGSSKFLTDGGNNDGFVVDWRGTSDPCGLKYPILWASANFNGKAGIVVNSSMNLTPTRTGAGAYTLTFGAQPPSTNYLIQATSEDGSVAATQICSPGQATSTASFTVSVTDAAGVAQDGRTVQVTVWAIPS